METTENTEFESGYFKIVKFSNGKFGIYDSKNKGFIDNTMKNVWYNPEYQERHCQFKNISNAIKHLKKITVEHCINFEFMTKDEILAEQELEKNIFQKFLKLFK